MRRRMRRTRRTAHILIAALLISGSVMLFPSSGSAVGPVAGGEWLLTPEALVRTAAGDCDSGRICLEWCFNGVTTGDFACFDHVPVN